jgi:hypothetical protein
MSERVRLLSEELQAVFGDTFGAMIGSRAGLSGEIDAYLAERMGPMQGKRGGAMPAKGVVRGKGGGEVPFEKKGKKNKGKKAGLVRIKKQAKKAAAKHSEKQKKREAEGQKAIDAFRAEVDKRAKEHKAKKAAKQSSAGGASEVGASRKNVGARGKSGGGGGGRREHYPFKRSPNLGKGPGTPPGFTGTGPRHHDETHCWKCSCPRGAYGGCPCTSTGNGKNCPPAGTVKEISIKPQYKRAYNKHYRAWRANQGGAVTARLGRTR